MERGHAASARLLTQTSRFTQSRGFPYKRPYKYTHRVLKNYAGTGPVGIGREEPVRMDPAHGLQGRAIKMAAAERAVRTLNVASGTSRILKIMLPGEKDIMCNLEEVYDELV